MKKLIFTAAALLVLAGSTFQIAPASSTQTADKNSPVLSGKRTFGTIPPPTCPPNDPNGCGILD